MSDETSNNTPIDDTGAKASSDSKVEAAPEPSQEEVLAEEQKKYLYLRAEFENFKRNAIKERSDLIKFGSERLIGELLNVLDVFETALTTEIDSENFESFKTGIEMTKKELDQVLERFGVSQLNPQGQAFNPEQHEALSSEETSDVEEGHVYRVFKKAYKLHDRIIRPAQVVVAKKPEPTKD